MISPKDDLLVILESSSELSPESSKLSGRRCLGIARVADDGSSSPERKYTDIKVQPEDIMAQLGRIRSHGCCDGSLLRSNKRQGGRVNFDATEGKVEIEIDSLLAIKSGCRERKASAEP